eukprot:TRINITY_DN726_c0_g1_i3.p1 TRINITY_DN726_c0_g1~~TRINITY_DN726_c0_g1_i3.p1  ORF type:complete len:106 (+),score=31.46 TRINITY_DN726_c0_g1_i3:189-506(+)
MLTALDAKLSLFACDALHTLTVVSNQLESMLQLENCPMLRHISIESDSLTFLNLRRLSVETLRTEQCPNLKQVELAEFDGHVDGLEARGVEVVVRMMKRGGFGAL